MSIHIDSLIVEVTRKCNMECSHCLRGPGEETFLNPDHIEKLFSRIDTIGCITFTGGEP